MYYNKKKEKKVKVKCDESTKVQSHWDIEWYLTTLRGDIIITSLCPICPPPIKLNTTPFPINFSLSLISPFSTVSRCSLSRISAALSPSLSKKYPRFILSLAALYAARVCEFFNLPVCILVYCGFNHWLFDWCGFVFRSEGFTLELDLFQLLKGWWIRVSL